MTAPQEVAPSPDAAPMVQLLDRVHAALIHADYAQLGPLAVEIEAELAQLERARDGATLLRVQALARRNEICLQSAQRGFRAARRRVEDIKTARSGLVTYDTTGRRATPHPTGDLAKRL